MMLPSSSSSSTWKQQRSTGTRRKKLELKKIEKERARHVTFSKRRSGLFKRAAQLSLLCGAEVGVVAFSSTGRPYSLGSPSIDAVIERYLVRELRQHPPNYYYETTTTPGGHSKDVLDACEKLDELHDEKKKKKWRKGATRGRWWKHDEEEGIEEGLGMEELLELKAAVEELRIAVAGRTAGGAYVSQRLNNEIV